MKSTVEETMRRLFSPEFLNRIDDYIVFKTLTKENMHKIIDINLGRLAKRLEASGITIDVTKQAKDFLSEKGFDEKYGARPLRRTIQKYVEDSLAEELLRGDLKSGKKIRIKLDKKTNELVFTEVSTKDKGGSEESEEIAESTTE
jgi:ATP-dependent Clp protease ATP-binding subunit ClpC